LTDEGEWRHPNSPPPFHCVICGETKRTGWISHKRDWPIPPVCAGCCNSWGRPVAGGANRDRYILRTISALLTKLETEAYCKIHRMPYGRA
jgi:hypothetical protein